MYERIIVAVLLSAGLAACGGGGGGTTAAPPATQTPPPVTPPPITPTQPPAVPTGVTAVAKDGYVLLDAPAVSGATAYNIYWSATSGVSKTTGTKITVTTSPQTHSGLTNGQPYYYVVTAVNSAGESADSVQVSATPATAAVVVDPLFADQWHLLNASQPGATGTLAKAGEDINVQTAWGTTKGQGVRIAIVDDGLEVGHEDLAGNMGANGLSHNYDPTMPGTSDPTNDPADLTAGHGTSVAGIAAARDSNGLGGSGVAPRATLVGYNLLQNSSASNEYDAMTRNMTSVGVSSNSWGPSDNTGNIASSTSLWRTAIDLGRTIGRGGKGTVYTWAAGNGRGGSYIDNSNYDGKANYRGVIAVAAVNDQGVQSSYSESGANLWVSAPGGEFCSTHAITTTDRTGNWGRNTTATAGVSNLADSNYTKCMNGTSSATPVVSGVVALMLAANPNLTERDVRIILAETARKNDALDAGWGVTAGTPVYHFNHKYGFGVVDATAAVAAAVARGTTNVAALKTYPTTLATPALTIPDATSPSVGVTVPGAPVSNTINVAGSGITSIEYVEVTFSAADHPYAGDLNITLTSPNGAPATVSQLANQHICNTGATCTAYSGWVFGSARHLGEPADGNWTLTVKDLNPTDAGTFQSWKLTFYGH